MKHNLITITSLIVVGLIIAILAWTRFFERPIRIEIPDVRDTFTPSYTPSYTDLKGKG